MKAQKIIVHSLIKKENQQKATVDLSHSLLGLDEMSLGLIEKLDDSYKNTQITYAVFNNDPADVFPAEFENYYRLNNDQAFLAFSQKAVTNLKQRVENISPAKGGYLVFTQYGINNRNYVAVFLIRDTVGVLFKKDHSKSAYVINPAEHLDLNKLAMACRVDLDYYSSKNGKYLSFMKRKMDDISDYFIKWISVQDRENNKTLTQSLYQLINIVDLPKNELGEETPREAFREQVFDYVKTSKLVNIDELSEHFYSDSTFLRISAENNKIAINTEFKPDSKVMKKFVRIDLSSDGIQVRFSRGDLNTKIRIDEDNRNRVIIESAKFARELQKEIEINRDEIE